MHLYIMKCIYFWNIPDFLALFPRAPENEIADPHGVSNDSLQLLLPGSSSLLYPLSQSRTVAATDFHNVSHATHRDIA